MRCRIIQLASLLILISILIVPVWAQAEEAALDVWLIQSLVPEANALLSQQINDWAQNTGIDVEITFVTFAEYGEKYTEAAETGTLPDLGEIPADIPLRFGDDLLDVSDVVEELVQVEGEILENVAPIVMKDDGFIAVPRFAPTSVMFIRSDIMEAKGLEPPTTWEEFETFVEEMNNPGSGIYGFGQTLNPSEDGTRFLYALLWSFGGGLFNEASEPDVLRESNIEAMQFAIDMVQDWNVLPLDVMTWDDGGNNRSYLAGEIAVTFNGASLYYAMVANGVTLDDGSLLVDNTLMLPFPAGSAGSAITSVPFSWGIFDHTEQPDLLKDLIRHVQAPEQFDEYIAVSVGQAAPVYEGQFNDIYWQEHPEFDPLLKAVRDGIVLGHPGEITKLAVVVDSERLLIHAINRVISGEVALEEALMDLQEQIAQTQE